MRNGIHLFCGILACGLGLGSAGLAWAENEGQTSLDQATEKKLDARELKDLGEAIRLAEKALTEGLDEANTQFAKSLLTSTYAQRGMQLAEMAQVSFETQPNNPRWATIRGTALQDLEKVLESDDKTPEIHYLIARLQILPAGKKDRALTAAEKAIELAAGDARLQAKALMIRADLGTEIDKQIEDLDKAVKLAPKDEEIVRARGLFFLLKANKPEKALADFKTAGEIEPKNSGNFHAQGLALLALERPAEARVVLDQAIELSPGSILPRIQRARTLLTLKEYDAAIEDLDTILENDSKNPAVLLLRARAYQLLDKTDEAKADIEAALKNRPALPAAIEMRAMIAAGSGDFRQAIYDFEELLKLDDKNSELLAQLGVLHSASKQPRKAIARFTAALADGKESFVALRGRADALLSVGKHAEAIADYELALKLKPKDSGVLNNLAWVLATSPEDSVRDGKRAIELGTAACEATEYKQAHILSTLAAAYAEAEDWDNAVKWSQKAVEIDHNNEHQEQIKKELESYQKKTKWREKQDEPDAAEPPAGKSAEKAKPEGKAKSDKEKDAANDKPDESKPDEKKE